MYCDYLNDSGKLFTKWTSHDMVTYIFLSLTYTLWNLGLETMPWLTMVKSPWLIIPVHGQI